MQITQTDSKYDSANAHHPAGRTSRGCCKDWPGTNLDVTCLCMQITQDTPSMTVLMLTIQLVGLAGIAVRIGQGLI